MEIDKLGNLKTLKELKEKLRKMKEAWKKNARTITVKQNNPLNFVNFTRI